MFSYVLLYLDIVQISSIFRIVLEIYVVYHTLKGLFMDIKNTNKYSNTYLPSRKWWEFGVNV